jgi:hypothetical protein
VSASNVNVSMVNVSMVNVSMVNVSIALNDLVRRKVEKDFYFVSAAEL